LADEGSVAQNAFRVTRLLVPVDGSPNSQRAAEAAIGLAKQHHAQIMFLNVIPLPRLTYGAAGVLGAPAVPLDSYYEYAESQGENLIERLVELAKEIK
jgi:nucleotide-binding universal stress UspA family protein